MWEHLSNLDYKALGVQLLANSAVIGVAGWIAKTWAEQRLESVKGSQARELEKTKAEIDRISSELNAGLDKRRMVFETHFNLEFSSYQELWRYCDDCFVIASQTLQYIQREPVDDDALEEEKVNLIARYDDCRELYSKVRRLRPFIESSVADKSIDLAHRCLLITNTYKDVFLSDIKGRKSGEYFDRRPFIKEIADELVTAGSTYDEVAKLISQRIDKLYIADFSKN